VAWDNLIPLGNDNSDHGERTQPADERNVKDRRLPEKAIAAQRRVMPAHRRSIPRQEVKGKLVELLPVFFIRAMARSIEDFQVRPLQDTVHLLPTLKRHRLVIASPYDQGRHVHFSQRAHVIRQCMEELLSQDIERAAWSSARRRCG